MKRRPTVSDLELTLKAEEFTKSGWEATVAHISLGNDQG